MARLQQANDEAVKRMYDQVVAAILKMEDAMFLEPLDYSVPMGMAPFFRIQPMPPYEAMKLLEEMQNGG